MPINAKRMIAGSMFAMLLGGLGNTASAVPLDQISGDVLFKFLGGSTSQNTFQSGTCGVGDGCENTWVGATLTQIVDAGSLLPVFNQGENGQFLAAILYGVSDISITPGGLFGNQIYSAGATAGGTGGEGDGRIYIDMYLRNSAPDLTGGPANRTGYETYTGISDGGTLFLRLELTEGIAVDDPTTAAVDESQATLVQDATAATNPATGQGSFYANVVGGSAAAQFDGNGFFMPNNSQFADMFGIFDFNVARTDSVGIPGCTTPAGVTTVQETCWENRVSDPIEARTAVPEPGTVGIAGLALIAMGALRRRLRRS